jgi:hypothetical protein
MLDLEKPSRVNVGFGKTEPPRKRDAIREFEKSLDRALAEAEAGHANRLRMIDALESCANALRMKQATSYSLVPGAFSGNLEDFDKVVNP